MHTNMQDFEVNHNANLYESFSHQQKRNKQIGTNFAPLEF